MCENLVKIWLNEFQNITAPDFDRFAENEKQNGDRIATIFTVFENPKFSHLITPVCHQLFQYYQCGNQNLQLFTLQLLPLLIATYLETAVDKTPNPILETLLLSLYNLEIIDQQSNEPKVISFRIPSIAQPSIYHEPINISSLFLTESSLRHWEECNTKLISWGPNSQMKSFNAQNRLKIVTALMFIFNLNLKQFNNQFLINFAKLFSKLATRGFRSKSRLADDNGQKRRVPVNSAFLLEILQSIYCALDDEKLSTHSSVTLQALEDIQFRAKYESFFDVYLKVNAIRNNASTSVQSFQKFSNISSKSLITNASFRVKKLPDDIPMLENDHKPDDNLNSIIEENEDYSSQQHHHHHQQQQQQQQQQHQQCIQTTNDANRNSSYTTTISNANFSRSL